jgi:hypothetical protein
VSSVWPTALGPPARGGGVAGGDHATAELARARGPGHAAMGQRKLLASGPATILFLKFQNQHKFVIQFGDFSFVKNSPKF